MRKRKRKARRRRDLWKHALDILNNACQAERLRLVKNRIEPFGSRLDNNGVDFTRVEPVEEGRRHGHD